MDNEKARRAELGRERLKELMDEQKLTQRGLAKMISELGITHSDQRGTIEGILNGKRYFTVRSADDIAPALGVTSAYLLGTSNDRMAADDQSGDEGGQEKPKIFPDILPPEPDLIGRGDQLKAVKERLFAADKQNRFALHGIPGVGKTALALKLVYDREVRERFREGILWAGLGRDGDVLAQLGVWAGKLGISPEALKELTTIEQRGREIRTVIGDRRMLLVADDIWTNDAAVKFSIGGPNCVHVITARSPEVALLFADEEGTIPVRELTEEDGLALLAKLAPRAVKAEPKMARELVRAVGGLPLALKLMGSYLKGKGGRGRAGIRRALERLQSTEERLRLEAPQDSLDQHPSLPEGAHISLWAVIQISDATLHEEARRALYALSVFPSQPNTFSEEAALAVTAVSVEVIDELLDAGLLEANVQGRYFLHQTIADYAGSKRSDGAPYERMVAFFENYLEHHERGNRDWNYIQELANILEAGREISAQDEPEEDLQIFLEIADEMEWLEGSGCYKIDAGLLDLVLPQDEVESALREKWETAQELGLQGRFIGMVVILSALALRQGKYSEVKIYCEEGLSISRELGMDETTISLLINQGVSFLSQGLHEEARGCFEEGLELARKFGLRHSICLLLGNLGGVALNQGEYHKAKIFLDEALELEEDFRLKQDVVIVLINLGELALKCGLEDQAELYLQRALRMARELKLSFHISESLMLLGELALRRGLHSEAKIHFQDGLRIAQEKGYQENISLFLTKLGSLATLPGATST